MVGQKVSQRLDDIEDLEVMDHLRAGIQGIFGDLGAEGEKSIYLLLKFYRLSKLHIT